MNSIVCGDIHIKISKDLPIDWQMNRFRKLWDKLIDLCYAHNAGLVLVGDQFHNARPNLYEVQLFLELCHSLEKSHTSTHIIAGNHENMGSQGTTLDYFKATFDSLNSVHYYSEIEVWEGGKPEVEYVFVGHNQLQNWMDSGDTAWEGTRIIFSHFRPTVNQYIQEEIDVEKFLSTGDYIFCGDIHTDFSVGEKLVYTNSPLNNHFEPSPNCGVLLVTVDGSGVSWKRIQTSLPNLIQVTVKAEDFQDTVETTNFYRVEVTGTPDELRSIKTESPNTKLLKIPETLETYTETEIVAEVRELALEDALVEYMKELNYTEETISAMIGVLHEP